MQPVPLGKRHRPAPAWQVRALPASAYRPDSAVLPPACHFQSRGCNPFQQAAMLPGEPRTRQENRSAMSRFREALGCGRVLLMDGAMGTELQRAGMRAGECYELWNVTHPE